MAGCSSDFVSGDDLEAIFSLLDEDGFENDDELVESITFSVTEIESQPTEKKVQYDICLKTYKSERGVKRHKTISHKEKGDDIPFQVTSKINPLQFKGFVERSAQKLSVDECYPNELMEEFKNFIFTAQDAQDSFKFIEGCITHFNGDAEKFYPKMYKCMSQNIVFKDLSKNASLVLGLEVSNHVLAHLNDSSCFQNPGELDTTAETTLYKRIRASKKWNTLGSQQCLVILMAGKSEGEIVSMQERETLINAKNRGGLWKVKSEVQDIFLSVESKFRLYTKHSVSKIDSKHMLSKLMMSSSIRANYSEICANAEKNIPKETALNLLENLLVLYIRVKIFEN
eukprot:gene13194-14543_t